MKKNDRFLKGDIVIIHTLDEKLYGSIGVVMDTSIFTCEVLYPCENCTYMGIKGAYESSLMKKDLEVIDHINMDYIRRVDIFQGCIAYSYEHDSFFNDVEGGLVGASILIQNNHLLRNMVTAMVIHKDKEIAKTFKGHKEVSEIASWILENKCFSIKLMDKEI